MEMKVERRIATDREQVWAALNDIDVLRASIPGCDVLEAVGDTNFKAQITTKVGPVKAKFKFDVALSDMDPPNSYLISAEGQGGAAGFANGSCAVSLREDGADTILAYHAKANVGGKLAQLGGRLIDGTAQKMADEFFTSFSEIAVNGIPSAADDKQTDEQAASEVTATRPATSYWLWLLGLMVLLGLGYSVFA